ncbi:MAG TPA: hypothetical protein PLG98_11540, partial [Smithella sp.]|nr:hypothetical protein [Smithella sp.]
NMSMNASTIGLVVAAIAALTTVIVPFNRKAKETNAEMEAIVSATKKATEKFAEEKAKIEALNTILHDTNQSYKERKRALDEIQQLAPDYHAKLTTEGELINDNTQSIEDHVKSLEKDIQAEMLRAEIVEQIRQREMEMETARERIARGYQVLVSAGASGAGFQVQNWVTQAYTEAEAQEILTEAYNNRQSAIDALTKKLAELFSSDSKTAQKSKQLSKEELEELKKKKEQKQKIQEEYDKWLLDATNAANDELVNLQLQAERDRVDAMAEGASKRKAQFSLEQKKAIIEMQRYVRNVLNEQAKLEKNKGMSIGYGTFEVGADGTLAYKLAESGLTLTPEQQNVINEMVRKFNQDIVDTWVTEVTDLDIDSGYNLADKLLEQLDEEMISGLEKGGFNPLKQQASLIFADISDLSAEMIQSIIANAEQYLASNDLPEDIVSNFRGYIDKANEYLVEKNPWEALDIAQERYKKAQEDLKNAMATGDFEKQQQAILEMSNALSIAGKALDEINGIYDDMLGLLGEVAQAMGMDSGLASSIQNLVSAASKFAGEAVKSLGSIEKIGDAAQDATKKIGTGAATGASMGGSMGGLIGAFIGLAIAIVKVSSAIAEAEDAASEEQISRYIDKINAKVDSLKRNLEAIASASGPGDGWFTEDFFNNVQRANDVVVQAMKDITGTLDDTYKRWNEVFQRMYGRSIYNKGGGENIKNLLDLIKQIRSTLGYKDVDYDLIPDYLRNGESSKALEFSIDNLTKYVNLLKDLEAEYTTDGADVLAAEARALYEGLESYINAYKSLQESIVALTGDISGNILSTVNSMWKEIREGGETTFADLTAAAKKNISEVIDQMVSQQLWATTMSKYFDQLGVDLTAAIAGGGDPSAILGVFDTFWTGMEAGLKDYTKYYEAFLQKAEERGWDMTSGNKKEENPAAGSIKAMRDELSKLQEQWDSLSAAERESAEGEKLYGDIGNLEKRIQAAEDLYNVNIDVADSINGINAELSRLEAEWNAMSKAEREGAKGMKNRADKTYYEGLLNQAQGVQTSELEKMQALLDSAEAKYSLYQKWVQLYGKDTADQMMGDMLDDAESYVDELRSGIAELTAKVTEGTATDEEIAQLEAWEGQLEDIMNQGAQAAITAANEASQAWNDS